MRITGAHCAQRNKSISPINRPSAQYHGNIEKGVVFWNYSSATIDMMLGNVLQCCAVVNTAVSHYCLNMRCYQYWRHHVRTIPGH